AERNRYLETTVGYLTKAIAGAEAMGQRTDLAIYYKALAETRSLQGDPAAAYGYLLDYTALHDSLFSAKNNFVIAGLESERERVLKEKLNQLQNTRKRNERLAFIAGILLLAGIIAMILRNYRKQRALNKSLADEKERSENLLLNILPQEVAEELKINGTTTARYYDDVTVFFTDFVNFTRAGERMTTQKLVAELHTCFKAFDEIITKYNIEKIKTIGDAYLAVSGLPVTDSRHAENVMKATIEIRDFILRRRQELGNDTFEVRIGIHSGPVVAGIVGARKFAYDIWGDTVNTAARMEQKSEAGKINISQSTFDLVKDKYICSYRGEIEAKNKGMMKMYFVEKAVS
ncbi:MAG TPA: adenylate/guanylate cyclase domain-containing protein, partial [Chitinophagaceae bacterium]|nr:adenylate/guanylate cyclase domain-containing protein [Chitinophagaceae bacterium]